MLTDLEFERYRKQLNLPEWRKVQQMRLKEASILVVGAGGLGCGALPFLAAAGVGSITILDADVIELSNLARQVLYKTDDVGTSKAIKAAEALQALNPSIAILGVAENLSAANVSTYIAQHDLIIDCTDNFSTRYLINDTCVDLQKPFIYGAIHAWEGQFAVFHPGGPSYRSLFPVEPSPQEIPACDEVGVLGVLPGIIGLLQAKEAIFYLAGFESPAQQGLMTFDLRDMRLSSFRL
ncbi:HesA/MoeB/ThiF family protein [Aquirufa sp. HETE-83D]|uniref:HesA/MoeB/ThiF family protein n=1 Tax=Aquirufa esocilacus TaxID=3096513 RepID=A0ABW6DJZ1_9BACT